MQSASQRRASEMIVPAISLQNPAETFNSPATSSLKRSKRRHRLAFVCNGHDSQFGLSRPRTLQYLAQYLVGSWTFGLIRPECVNRLDSLSWLRVVSRPTRTAHGALLRTSSETLPRMKRPRAERPCVPTTTRSALHCAAAWINWAAGSTGRNFASHFPGRKVNCQL